MVGAISKIYLCAVWVLNIALFDLEYESETRLLELVAGLDATLGKGSESGSLGRKAPEQRWRAH